MSADEMFVREHWRAVSNSESMDKWKVCAGEGLKQLSSWESCRSAAWSAAAEFTRDRLEEIRQLERDIHRMTNCYWSGWNWQEYMDELEEEGQLVNAVCQQCSEVRIVARLQAKLEELKRWMR